MRCRSTRVSAPRPQASAFGAYADLHEEAAALLHAFARNRALVDGDKRLALAATIAFLGINGEQLTFTNDEAYDVSCALQKRAVAGAVPGVGHVALI